MRNLVAPIRRPLGRLKRRLFGAEPRSDGGGPEPTHRNPHFARRRCFAVPNNSVASAIRLNLVGREPHGRVRPGREADALIDVLRRDLLALVDPATGAPLVREIYRVADRYAGEHLDTLPDLIVEWHRAGLIEAAYSRRTGLVRVPYHGARTGDHVPDGLMAVTGPTLRSGRLPAPVDSIHLAPTIAAWLGVALEDVDGTPLPIDPVGPLVQAGRPARSVTPDRART
jgi:predicted AlkP superfamily phosphohydrolase/phosphomutase